LLITKVYIQKSFSCDYLLRHIPLQSIKQEALPCWLPAGRNSQKRMPIAKLTVELEIPHAQSLKDRRQVLRSMKDKLRHGFNLSIAELDDGMVWNRATLGIAAISSSTSYLTGQLHQIDEAVHRLAAALSAEVLDSYAEILAE
jgi:uncharacterized protein YlxP (DUF503 family)